MDPKFKATHVIQTAMRRWYVHAVPVDCISGGDRGGFVLYTEAEWNLYDNADWETDPDRLLLFQGSVSDATLETFDECKWTRVDGWNDDGTRANGS